MSLSIDDDWLKPAEPQAEDQRDAGHTSSVTGGLKSTILLTKINGKYLLFSYQNFIYLYELNR